MASVIKEFPRPTRGRPPKYDWNSCFDGEIHVWYKGRDFHTALSSFRALVHRTASARSDGTWKAETQIDKNAESVAFRFWQP